MTDDRSEGGPDRQATEGGEGTAEVEGGEPTADGETPAGGEQKETERVDEI